MGDLFVVDDGDVHVWEVDLATERGQPAADWLLLAPDERARAERFHFSRDRDRFVSARATLRRVLARYLPASAEAIAFGYGAHGKPSLFRGSGLPDVRFNLSHADDLALIAVTVGREIGIDLEAIRQTYPYARLAEQFFAPRETAVLHALAPHRQREAFFAAWTRKEAYSKARGDGLSAALDGFAVSLAPDEPAALLWVQNLPEEPGRWFLRSLDIGPGYAAALAVEGAIRGLHQQHWRR